jgi:2-amino-4-hydroxy-6-hydroxymethyldihydropteridine diphosphokinase
MEPSFRPAGSNRTVAVAIGSNLGDRRAHLDYAVARLRQLLDDLHVSGYYETSPVGVAGDQPDFLNAAAVGKTPMAADELLAALLAIEGDRGRTRPHAAAPRTLDLDLILFGDGIIDEPPSLIVPHPRYRDRLFVLEPLAEIAGSLRDPVTGETVADLRRRLIGRPHPEGPE